MTFTIPWRIFNVRLPITVALTGSIASWRRDRRTRTRPRDARLLSLPLVGCWWRRWLSVSCPTGLRHASGCGRPSSPGHHLHQKRLVLVQQVRSLVFSRCGCRCYRCCFWMVMVIVVIPMLAMAKPLSRAGCHSRSPNTVLCKFSWYITRFGCCGGREIMVRFLLHGSILPSQPPPPPPEAPIGPSTEISSWPPTAAATATAASSTRYKTRMTVPPHCGCTRAARPLGLRSSLIVLVRPS